MKLFTENKVLNVPLGVASEVLEVMARYCKKLDNEHMENTCVISHEFLIDLEILRYSISEPIDRIAFEGMVRNLYTEEGLTVMCVVPETNNCTHEIIHNTIRFMNYGYNVNDAIHIIDTVTMFANDNQQKRNARKY